MLLRVPNLKPDGIFSSPESLMVVTMQVVVTTWWKSERKLPGNKIHHGFSFSDVSLKTTEPAAEHCPKHQ